MSCALYPLVDGKKSILYGKLKDFTGNDRELTNFLYALSKQPAIAKKFTHSDLNGQGEVEVKKFIEVLGLEEILESKNIIFAEAKELGAVDKNNKPVYYETSQELLQKVLEFNDSHDTIKAVIKYNQNGYYMKVDTINASNFNYSNSLRTRMGIYDSFMQRLQDTGLNTYFSPDTAKHFGVTNIRYQLKYLSIFKDKFVPVNEDVANMFFDLFEAEPLAERLYQKFGEDLGKALSQVSGWHYEDDEKLEIDAYDKQLLNNFKDIVTNKMSSVMNSEAIKELVAEAETAFTAEKVYDVEGLDIQETLNELYHTYHLDNDTLDILTKKVKSVSEASQKLFQIRLKNYEEQKLKGVSNRKEKRNLQKSQKLLDNAKYMDSIANLLEQLKHEILSEEAITRLMDKRDKKLAESPDNLAVIQEYSNFIIKQLDLTKSFLPILKELRDSQFLENDDELSSKAVIDDIKSTANELFNALTTVETYARQKQTEVVHAFLKIYWGEDTAEARKARGSDTTLDDIMQAASKDINIFDRFIYAAGTCSDEMMALIAEAVKTAKDKRDKQLRKEIADINSITKELFDSGSKTSCVFELDEDGYPKRLLSNYDYSAYEADLEAFKKSLEDDPNISKADAEEKLTKWLNSHNKTVKEFGIELTVPFHKVNGKNIYAAKKTVRERLTPIEYKYYETMMQKKADMLKQIEAANNNTLYHVIELSNDAVSAFTDAGGDPKKAFDIIKNKVKDLFVVREDDTEFGISQHEILEGNGIINTHVDSQGNPITTLPLHYTHRIKDRSRVSTDFSKAMVAYLASSSDYVEMNKIIDALELSKDYMLNRDVHQQQNEGTLASVTNFGRKTYVSLASKMGLATDLGGLADDYFERNVYGKAKKIGKYSKVADFLTGYTSTVGLTVNALGAQANLYVGKLQMLIETGMGLGGEFFNMKDMAYADAKYFHMLGPLLLEMNSTTKSSPLGLLMDYFDVKEDFLEKIKETGFYKEPISKIIGNKNLFFLYGIGEHLLHAEGMIAVLHNKKNMVVDEHGKEHILLDAFYVEKDANGQGTLKVKEGWLRKDGGAIDEEYLNKVKGRIQYVNKSMHGAFGSLDKGMIHRYAFGRLVMNFRQWMPAHYSRRFRGRHYDTDLHEYREGYYVSTWKFVKELAKDAKRMKFQVATRWKDLDEGQRYNVRRAIAECAILGIISGMLALLGPAKDHKGNWAKRHLIYQLSRMQMEVAASTPISGYGFISNMIKMLQDPVAAVGTLEKFADLTRFTDAFETVESGKYKGRNKYSRDLERSLPFYGQFMKMLDMGEENDLFLLFN